MDRRNFLKQIISGALVCAAGPLKNATAATTFDTKLWPDGVIPYKYPHGHKFASYIYRAILEMNDKTNVEFMDYPVYTATMRERGQSISASRYIYFVEDYNESQYAHVGYKFQSKVNINKNVRAVHELGHVVGLIHEHQRSDRDNYIEFTSAFNRNNFNDDLNWKKIGNSINGPVRVYPQINPRTGRAYIDRHTGRTKFELRKTPGLADIPYNINSFMHYWHTAGGDGSSQTMIYKPNRTYGFGTPNWLNDLAVQAVNALYPTRSPFKPAFTYVNSVRSGSAALYSARGFSYLDAGPNHLRGYKSSEEKSNPFLRWQPRHIGGDTYVLYNKHRNGYLDAGSNHFRSFNKGEDRSNPFLRWQFIKKYNYYVLYNAHTRSYLSATTNNSFGGHKHTQGQYIDADLMNPYLRWNLYT